MIIIIPLGGIGQRFKDNGYTLPKALVKVFSKPILYWLLDSISSSVAFDHISFIYIPYNAEYAACRLEDMLRKDYHSLRFRFYELPSNTKGAADTIRIALHQLILSNEPDAPILSMDCDNFYTEDVLAKWGCSNKVFVFEDIGSSAVYSYVKLDHPTDCNRVTDIVEKQKISDLACTGAYGFRSYKELYACCSNVIEQNITYGSTEFYTSGVIKNMIASGESGSIFTAERVTKENFVCLGTPLQIRIFYNNYPKVNSKNNRSNIESKRYCFDLDNTLVTFPDVKGDYSTVRPIESNIKMVRYLKKFGHTIIIYTARRMGTHKNNVGKAIADIGRITFETLEKFDIPYDEIYFGKPNADVYVDDLAVSAFADLEKELGYYDTSILPRDFNSIGTGFIETYKKMSNDLSTDLSGEIYFYSNIPQPIKDMFPVMFDADPSNRWFVMEKIHGIPVSKLYLSELLTIDNLKHIMNSIDRLHKTQVMCGSTESIELTDIYANYVPKLKKRYAEYDYSKYPNSHAIYTELINALQAYEDKAEGKMTIIHGDPVFTNIIINVHGKIKFIDMRGKLGTKLSVCGDHLYDWAKLFQSLVGYDEVLDGTKVGRTYKASMIDAFEKHIKEFLSDREIQMTKIITKSLLFSLIPLHHNEKCAKYYGLIDQV